MSTSVGGGESDSDVSVGRGDETYQPMAEDVFRYTLRLTSTKHTTSSITVAYKLLASVLGSSPASDHMRLQLKSRARAQVYFSTCNSTELLSCLQ